MAASAAEERVWRAPIPEYTSAIFSVTIRIFWYDVSSISIEGTFFSVAMTTPFLAGKRVQAGQRCVNESESEGRVEGARDVQRARALDRCGECALAAQDEGSCAAPLTPSDVAPEATALSAYSICTSLPEGLKVVSEKE